MYFKMIFLKSLTTIKVNHSESHIKQKLSSSVAFFAEIES